METTFDNENINQIRDWSIERIKFLHESDRHRNARAISAEFEEWINIDEYNNELEYICLENEDWTDEQELDIIEPGA